MTEMVIEVPENWRAFLQDVAERMKEEPAKYWGDYFVDHLKNAMEGDRYWLFCNMQVELVEKHGLTLRDEE
jgi:hypothetical protein